MTEIKTDTPGVVRVSDEVLIVIAGTAALEIEGVVGIGGQYLSNLNDKSVRKDMIRGIRLKIVGEEVKIGISITVKYGYKIPDVSTRVQERVKTAVETMTGLTVKTVNVIVSALVNDNKKV